MAASASLKEVKHEPYIHRPDGCTYVFYGTTLQRLCTHEAREASGHEVASDADDRAPFSGER